MDSESLSASQRRELEQAMTSESLSASQRRELEQAMTYLEVDETAHDIDAYNRGMREISQQQARIDMQRTKLVRKERGQGQYSRRSRNASAGARAPQNQPRPPQPSPYRRGGALERHGTTNDLGFVTSWSTKVGGRLNTSVPWADGLISARDPLYRGRAAGTAERLSDGTTLKTAAYFSTQAASRRLAETHDRQYRANDILSQKFRESVLKITPQVGGAAPGAGDRAPRNNATQSLTITMEYDFLAFDSQPRAACEAYKANVAATIASVLDVPPDRIEVLGHSEGDSPPLIFVSFYCVTSYCTIILW